VSAPPPRGPGGEVTVIVPMPPSYRGGTEEYAYQLVRSYSASRPVQVLTTNVRWNGGSDALAIGTARLDLLDAREVFQRPVVVGTAARAHLRQAIERSSVVQLHMPFPWVERQVTHWARRAGVPTVLTYHMDAQFGGGAGWSSRVVTGAYQWTSATAALDACSAVVSNSLGYARASPLLSRFMGKVRVIYQGIDLDRLRANGGGTGIVPPRTDGVGRVVFVGRLVGYKGLDDLLAAMQRVVAGGRRVELLIGGKGPELDRLRALSTHLGLDGSVRFLGFVPDGAVGPLYAGADVVVCPSVSLLESTPITLQEAMAFGTPVLGTTLPGTEETVPDDGVHGRLVAPRDPNALAAALIELLDHGQRSDRPFVRGWDATARDYLALFDELTAGGRAG